MSQRYITYDIAKCICIVLICIFHICNTSNFVSENFANIALPAFFFISAIFDKPWQSSLISGIKKSALHLLVPYFVLSAISLLTCWVSPYMHPELYPGYTSVYQSVIRGGYGLLLAYDNVTPTSFLPNEPLWFLPALFCVKVMFLMTYHAIEHKRFGYLTLITLFIALTYFFSIRYWGLYSAIYALAFYSAGYFYGRRRKLVENLKIPQLCLMLAVGLLLMALTHGDLSHTSMDAACYDNYALFIPFGIASTIVIILLSDILYKLRPNGFIQTQLGRVGSITLLILAIHVDIGRLFKVASVLILHSTDISVIGSLLITAVICVVALPLNRFILKNCPIILGKFTR